MSLITRKGILSETCSWVTVCSPNFGYLQDREFKNMSGEAFAQYWIKGINPFYSKLYVGSLNPVLDMG